MERWEMMNMALTPVDLVVKAPIQLMKAVNMYEPFRDWFYKNIKNNLMSQFKENFQLEIIGEENVPDAGGVIVAANHQSWLDAQVIGASCKRKAHFIAKSMFKDWPLLPILYELNETLYIDRKGGETSGLEEVIDALKQGHLVAIFPEGTIPGEEEVPRTDMDPETGFLKGRTGVIRTAIMAGVPIVPLGVSGTGPAFPPEAYPRMEMPPAQTPFPITLRYGKPIKINLKPEQITKENLRENTDLVMRKISELVDHRRDFVAVRELPIKPVQPMKYSPKTEGGKKAPFGALVLHGFTSAIECVSGLAPYLKKRKIPYRIPILRGHGGQPQDMIGVTHQDWYADAEAALKDLAQEAEKIIVIGLSMGGLVSIDLGINHPDLVSNVVLIAAALKFADPGSAFTSVLSKVFKFWPSPCSYNDKELELKNNLNYRIFATDSFASLYEYAGLIEKKLKEFDRPVLILETRADGVVAPKAAEIINKKISSKDKKLVWFEKTGHEMLLDLEAESVAKTIDDYIAKVTGS